MDDMHVNALIARFTDRVDKGKDYHEVHEDGNLTRGKIGDVCYQQVLDGDEVVFTVAVKGNLLGQFYSEDVWAIVDLDTNTIVEGRALGEVAARIREDSESDDDDFDLSPGALIVAEAQNEAACPRWGMSW